MPKVKVKKETKVKLSLTITPTQKEKLFTVCEKKNISASEYIGKWIEREYKKMEKKSESQK